MIGRCALRTEIFGAQRPTQNNLWCATPHLKNCGAQCPRRAEALHIKNFWCAILHTHMIAHEGRVNLSFLKMESFGTQ